MRPSHNPLYCHNPWFADRFQSIEISVIYIIALSTSPQLYTKAVHTQELGSIRGVQSIQQLQNQYLPSSSQCMYDIDA